MSQSSAHIPPIKPSDLTPEQKGGYDVCVRVMENAFPQVFKWRDDEGALLGPFPSYLTIPGFVKPLAGSLKAISDVPGISTTVKETVILLTGIHFNTIYEIYAHERIALETTDLTKAQILMIKAGEKPQDLGQDVSIAYDAAKELLEKPGQLKKEIWDELVGEFGKEGAMAVVHWVGNYAYTCILMNAAATSLPEGEKLFE